MSREEQRTEWDRLDKEWDQLSKEQQAERLTQLHRQKRAKDQTVPTAEVKAGVPSVWYHPERYSPHDLLRVEFFELIQEIVPEALGKLREDVLPSYEKLFEAGFLNVSDWGGALSFRGSDKEDVERLMSEPAALIWQLRRIQGADYDGLVNDFRAAFNAALSSGMSSRIFTMACSCTSIYSAKDDRFRNWAIGSSFFARRVGWSIGR